MFQISPQAQKFLKENKQSQKTVFTNGCFDILHIGHLHYLIEARKCGDLLFIGLNSDSSVRRLKGETRPINSESDRKFFLENLRMVDFVEIFEEDTPYNLINEVKPEVLVKGGDWKINEIVGHDIVSSYGGQVKSLSFVEGYSTSNLISNLQGKQ